MPQGVRQHRRIQAEAKEVFREIARDRERGVSRIGRGSLVVVVRGG
jgi:hypothetical protein